MDEILFENVFTEDENTLTEIGKTHRGSFRQIFLVILILLTLYFAQAAVASILMWQDYTYLLFVLVYLLLDLYYLFAPRINARIYMKRSLKFHDGMIPEHRISCTGKELCATFGKQQVLIPYDKLDKAAVTKHCIVLTAKKYARITLRKDSFTKGTYEEFTQFLRAKCPALKIPN